MNNAILCGDDYFSANINRKDLGGGVERAVIEMCPFHVRRGNFWYYRHSAINRFLFKLTMIQRLIIFIRRNAYKLRVRLYPLK